MAKRATRFNRLAQLELIVVLGISMLAFVMLVSSGSEAAVSPCNGGAISPGAPQACPPVLRIFEGEVNQGLRDYQLVAGKDTLVRVFVGVAPQEISTNPPPVTFLLNIERAELDVKSSIGGGVLFTESVIHNPILNTTQKYSENYNVNFYLEGSKLLAGDYKLTARLYSNSATPVTVFEFPKTYSFTLTKDLGLLIIFLKGNPVPECDGLTDKECYDLSTDKILGPYLTNEILPTISRLYPIRNGIGFIDTGCNGNKISGLRYFIYPDLLEAAAAGDAVQQKSVLDRFNQSLQLGPPRCVDSADKIVTMFRSETMPKRDFYNGIEGGNGDYGGRTSRVAIALDPISKMTGAGTAGWFVAHEVGHNFGLVDWSEPNWDGGSHSKNFYIEDLSAFNLSQRLSIAPRKLSAPLNPFDYQCPKPSAAPPLFAGFYPSPSSVMIGAYPSTAKTTANDYCVLFEVPDWNFLLDKLASASTILLPPEQPVFYIAGTISRDDGFRTLDSRFLPSGSAPDPAINSPYTIVIVNSRGQELASNGFRIGFESHIDQANPGGVATEVLTNAPFSVAQVFPRGGSEVQLRHNQTIIARLRPTRSSPHVRLIAPGGGEVFGPGNREMLIQWRGRDADGDPLTYTLSFSSDGGQTFLPIGTVFGLKTTSYVWDTSFAPVSTKQGVIRVEASDGFNVATASSEEFTVVLACDVNKDGDGKRYGARNRCVHDKD